MTHRGSDLSHASGDEIKKIESDQTIQEDEEEEDCEPSAKRTSAAIKAAGNKAPTETRKAPSGAEAEDPVEATEVKKDDKKAEALSKDLDRVKLKDQEAADPKQATSSVED
jgi:hypothetical protein